VAGVKLGMSPDAVRAVLKSKNLRQYKEWTETLSSLSQQRHQPVDSERTVRERHRRLDAFGLRRAG